MREHIERTLYGTGGYFAQAGGPVLAHARGCSALRAMRGRDDYERAVAASYARAPHGWATPAELFSPHMGRAVAARLAAAAPSAGSLAVVELGGGTGTLAADALAYLRETHPNVADRLEYRLIDVSPTLSQRQAAAVAKWRGAVATVAHARDWLCEFGPRFAEKHTHVHVIATELLDNLPHDLVRLRPGEPPAQAYVVGTPPGPFELDWRHAIDASAARAFIDFDLTGAATAHQQPSSPLAALWGAVERAMDSGVHHVWVPTVAHQILEAICENLPGASVTFADFTSFPGALPHINGPVVQRVERGVAKVFDSVEGAPMGMVDIMFPTDFQQLERTYRAIWKRQGNNSTHELRTKVVTQHEFFKKFASKEEISNSSCKDGFNPILSDFANVDFILTDSVHLSTNKNR